MLSAVGYSGEHARLGSLWYTVLISTDRKPAVVDQGEAWSSLFLHRSVRRCL